MQIVQNQNQSNLMETLLAGFRPQLPARSSMVKGDVVMLTAEWAYVSIGQKTESLVSRDEADKFGLKVGDSRTFFVVNEPDEDGATILSLAWGTVRDAQENNSTQEARITGLARAKGSDHIPGVKAEINGLRAFIPASKLEVRGPAIERLVGTTVSVKVLTADLEARKIVLSQKDAAEEMRAAKLAQLKPGELVVGTVTNVTEFGVFAAIGNGLSGLLHKSDLVGNRPVSQQKLKELMPVGSVVNLVVKSIDVANGKVSLSVTETPASRVFETLECGMSLTGRVARIVSFGAFVELAGCVDGLLHNSALGVKDKTAADLLTIGQIVEVVVENFNAEKEKVSLVLKQPQQA